jgi:protein phosphatase
MLWDMSTLYDLGPGLRLEVAARTDRGRERAQNEDVHLVTSTKDAVALAVCDGMGGSAGGAVASRRAADAIAAWLEGRAWPSRDAMARALVDALQDASRRVHAAALTDRALTGMGTTATLAAIVPARPGGASGLVRSGGASLLVAQVGDSRAYVFRGGRLAQVTRDQTLAQMLLETGQLAPEEVAKYPFGHVILQAIGTQPRVEVDLRAARLCRGDVILVCSDGLHGPLRPAEIAHVLSRSSRAGGASGLVRSGGAGLDAGCDDLVACANEHGGPDNVTCVVARVDGDALPSPDEPVTAHPYVLPPLPPEEPGTIFAHSWGRRT